jgi:AbrB family looped-hinge helix DNA binding protein
VYVSNRRIKITEDGSIIIPDEYRQALGVHVGDEVILSLEDGSLHIFTLNQAIKRAQELVRRYVPEGRSLSDELIAERREESKNE